MKDLNMDTSQGLAEAARLYGIMGDTGKQVAMTQMAQEKAKAEAAFKQQQAMTTSLADRAEKQDMPDLAETIRTGAHPDLKNAAKEIQAEERKQVAMKRGVQGRRVLARQAGFTDEEFDRDLKDLQPEDFLKVIDGEEGTTKAFTNAAGKDVMLAADKYGRVWKDGKRYRPEELGLRPAPQKTQEVILCCR